MDKSRTKICNFSFQVKRKKVLQKENGKNAMKYLLLLWQLNRSTLLTLFKKVYVSHGNSSNYILYTIPQQNKTLKNITQSHILKYIKRQ